MARMVVLAITTVVAAFGSAHAQTGNPAASAAAPGPAGPSVLSAAGTNSSASERDPALSLRGMPCSVSLNATGGVTTSPSCGSDPLEVPARTVVSPEQVNGSQAPSVQTSGGATGGTQSSTRPSSGASSGSAASGASAATTSTGAGGAGAPSSFAFCSTTTAGPTGAGSLLGGC